ncbi:MAG: PEGA domain-containing protein [Deltaproteobacteria bacterium]|nr:PEGA domain-containing protein [Deltaproteobacteria bacterium]
MIGRAGIAWGMLLGLAAAPPAAAQNTPEAVVMVDRAQGRGPPVPGVLLSADGMVVVPAEAVAGAATVTLHRSDQSEQRARFIQRDEESGLALLMGSPVPGQPTLRFYSGKPLEKGATLTVRGVEGGLAWQSAKAVVVSTQTGPWGNLTQGYLTLDGETAGTGADTGAAVFAPDGTLAAVHVGRLRVEGAPPGRFVAVSVERLRAFLATATRGQAVGRLCVTAETPGATLVLDGKPLGALPRTLEGLEAGWRTVRVEAPKHAPQERLVEAGWEGGNCQRFDLRPAGSVRFTTTVQNVEMSVDGAPAVPVGGRALELPGGDHLVRFVARGYRPQSWAGTVTAGTELTEAITLVREHGLLSVTSVPPGATVLVEGREAGVTPLKELKLAPGRWNVELRLPHHHVRAVADVTVRDAGAVDLGELTLAPLPARLTLATGSVESGDEVYLNGRRVAGRSWKVEPGFHDLEIRRAWHLPAKARLRLEADEERSVSLRPELTGAARTRRLKIAGGVVGVVLGTVAAAGAVAAVAGGAALLAGAKLAYDRYMLEVSRPAVAQAYWLANGLTWSGAGVITLSAVGIVVAVAAVAGATWAFLTLPGDPARAVARPAPAPGGGA